MARHTFERFPASRLATIDVGALGRRRHLVAGLLQVDVTEARARMKAHEERSGERLSFTAWLIHVLACTLAEHPTVHAYPLSRLWRAIPHAVDVSTLVERKAFGQRVPLPTVIRNADRLDVHAVTRELRAVQQGAGKGGGLEKATRGLARAGSQLYAMAPGRLRRVLWRAALSIPPLADGLMGSAVVTSVGMMGRVDGWFVHTSLHPVSLGVGSILRKPMVVDGDRVVPRDVVHLTLLLDHDVVDGGDMARFADAFVRRLEAAQGLPGLDSSA
jgi:pyruvate/2-oxoglutarate dehydrogenase complex dihydrolipoamide acyltransferase (E2) component